LSIKNVRLTAAFLLFVIYIPGVAFTGIWSDDYPTLINPESHQIHASRDGRPVFGLFLQIAFGLARGVDDLWAIRLVGLVGILLLNDFVLRKLLAQNLDLRIIVSTIGAFCVVGFQLSIHWATAFVFTWVAYFSLVGFFLLLKDSLVKKFLGILLLTICSLSYPILTFFFVPIIFLLWFEVENTRKNFMKNSAWGFAGIAVSAISAFLINLFLLQLRNFTFNDRVAIITLTEIPNQILWFVTHPLVLSFRAFSIISPDLLEVLVGLIVTNLLIFTGIHLKINSVIKSLKIHIIVICFASFAMAPLVLTNQQQIDMRFVTVGSWLISYMLISSVFMIFQRMAAGRIKIRPEFLALGLVIIFFFNTNSRYLSVIRPIYLSTHTFISEEVRACSDSQILNGVFVIPRTVEWPSNDFIGIFSQVTDLASSWVPLEAVQIEFGENPRLQGFNAPVAWGNTASSGCIVDLNDY
jgi:hypothetical protein